jgi:septum formation protein
MLEPLRESLNKTRIILASSSPRRKEILENIGLKLEIRPSLVEENLDRSLYAGKPADFVMDTAEIKADDVFHSAVMGSQQDRPVLVIGESSFFLKIVLNFPYLCISSL